MMARTRARTATLIAENGNPLTRASQTECSISEAPSFVHPRHGGRRHDLQPVAQLHSRSISVKPVVRSGALGSGDDAPTARKDNGTYRGPSSIVNDEDDARALSPHGETVRQTVENFS